MVRGVRLAQLFTLAWVGSDVSSRRASAVRRFETTDSGRSTPFGHTGFRTSRHKATNDSEHPAHKGSRLFWEPSDPASTPRAHGSLPAGRREPTEGGPGTRPRTAHRPRRG